MKEAGMQAFRNLVDPAYCGRELLNLLLRDIGFPVSQSVLEIGVFALRISRCRVLLTVRLKVCVSHLVNVLQWAVSADAESEGGHELFPAFYWALGICGADIAN